MEEPAILLNCKVQQGNMSRIVLSGRSYWSRYYFIDGLPISCLFYYSVILDCAHSHVVVGKKVPNGIINIPASA